MTERQSAFVHELRTPRAAAVAGIVFAVLLSVSIVLIQWSLPGRGQPAEWLTDGSRRRAMAFAIGLVPYAGIAFLWFIGVIRSRLGAQEDKFFATAFLGSGLLFIAMMFTAAALTGAVLDLYGGSVPVSTADTRLTAAVVASLLGTFGIRMAAVFTLVVTNLGRRTGFVPGWLVVIGYATAAVMLLATNGHRMDGAVVPGLGVPAQHQHADADAVFRRPMRRATLRPVSVDRSEAELFQCG